MDIKNVSLLPCPFCGEQPKVFRITGTIVCGGESCFGPVTTASNIEDSTTQWNKRMAAQEWQDISTAPKDGTDIWLYREDCGGFLGRWIAPIDFLTTKEMDAEGISNDDLDEPDWFYADFVKGGRVTDGAPTHWRPLPAGPLFAEERTDG